MKKHLICLDLDGTLLNSRRKIGLYSRLYLRHLARKGNVIVINTGRPFTGSIKYFKKLKIRQFPIVCNNGAAIITVDENYAIKSSITISISRNLILPLFNRSINFITSAFAMDNHHHYFYNTDIIPSFIKKFNSPLSIITGDFNEILSDEIIVVSFFVKDEHKAAFDEMLKEPQFADLSLYYWGIYHDVHSYNIGSKNASKGNALLYLKDKFEIEDDATIAFGDSFNDFEMLAQAHYGIAMKNGRDEVKRQAKFITRKDNDHNGIADYLKNVLKI